MATVSVCMITYNHENYIIQALKSVLEQKCDFQVEIILSNDCSTDSTNKIITDFLNTNTNTNQIQIKYFNHKVNLGITSNFLFTVNQCIGKYITICEGDDYWIDPLKLQKQVDFLEQNTSFSGIATNSLVKYEGSNKEHLFKAKIKSVLEINDFLEERHFHTATFMFKKEAFKDDFPKDVLSADRTLFLLVSCFGAIKVLDCVTAVYRKNDGGISRKVTSKQMKLDYKIINYIKKHNQEFDYNKLKVFISKTVLDYSFKIHFLDFIKASCLLVFYKFKEARGRHKKIKSIKQSFKEIYQTLDKVSM